MAKPAFIYAFDNLGPYRFTELCGELLALRYKGFLLGGVGADGGIDGEIDQYLGEWYPEAEDVLISEVIHSGQKVVFQFKHQVTARIGQANSRRNLLNLYRGTKSELQKTLIISKQPDVYVLITNIEVNSVFRNEFIEVCRSENPNIVNFQLIGLDDLEIWVTQARNLRHLYFPTIFELPRFNLNIQVSDSNIVPVSHGKPDFDEELKTLEVKVLNIGTSTSYVSNIGFKFIADGNSRTLYLHNFNPDPVISRLSSQFGTPLEPGRRQTFTYALEDVRFLRQEGQIVFFDSVVVWDEIGNFYESPFTNKLRQLLNH